MQVRGLASPTFRRFCSITVVFLLTFMATFSGASGAFAQEASPTSVDVAPIISAAEATVAPLPQDASITASPDTGSADATTDDAAPSGSSSSESATPATVATPTVPGVAAAPVSLPAGSVELTDKRDACTSVYRLPDGTMRAVISRTPVHYKDASGAWRDVNNAVVPATVVGEFRNSGGALTETFASPSSASHAVSVGQGDWSLDIDMPGASMGAPYALGAGASYLGVAQDTNLLYQPTGWGLKETMVLASADAPATFRFFVTTHGATLENNAAGSWVLADDRSGQQVARLGDILVRDSSAGLAGQYRAIPQATMAVTPTVGGAWVTYSLSPSWLHDPARVFPVYVDPTFDASPSSCGVTLSGSAQWSGEPLLAGFVFNGNAGDWTSVQGPYDSYVNFDTSSIGCSDTVTGANLAVDVTSCQHTDWMADLLVYEGGNCLGDDTSPYSGTQNFDVTGSVANWVANPACNGGFVLDGGNHSTWGDYAYEYMDNPVLTVDYAAPTTSPAPTTPNYATTSARGLGWYVQAGSSVATAGVGRGVATIGWTPAHGASGQDVYLFDGLTYLKVATLSSTATTWTTDSTPTLWPTDATIAALPSNDSTFTFGGGAPLRDDPRALYAKTAPGAATSNTPAYFFKVAAFNDHGETTLTSEPTITVELPNRSVHALGTPPEATFDAGSVAGLSAQVSLETSAGSSSASPGSFGDGRLELSATDLSIPSYGPAAELSRTYRSDLITGSRFGQGWVFNFDQSVTSTPGGATYTDQAGTPHYFTGASGVYSSPAGFVGTLSGGSGSNFSLALTGGETLAFSNTTGQLLSDTDSNNNSVGYNWTSPGLVITAANGRTITVAFAGSTITSATYAGRTFTYSYVTSSTVSTVTACANTPCAESVVYCAPFGQVTSISVPAFGAVGGESATWGFGYVGAQVTTITYPGYGTSLSDARYRQTDISYGSGTAAVTRFGSVDAAADTTITTTYTINPDGSLASRSNPNAGGQLWTYEYSQTGDQISQIDPLGDVTRSVFDGRGNEILSVDALGNATTTTYNSLDEPLVTTDPRGAVTNDSYNSSGDLTQETKTLNASDTASASYTYNAYGEKTEQDVAVFPTQTITTNYAYDASGEVATTTVSGVQLDPASSTTVNISSGKSYDATGEVIAETDGLGNTSSFTYDAAGRQLTSTDPSGTITHTAYDCLGDTTGSWKSTTTGTVGECVSCTVLPTGQTWVRTTWADASATTPAEITTTTYDPAGNAVSVADSVKGSSATSYTANSQEDRSWEFGSDTTSATQSTRTYYDSAGRTTTVTPAGNPDASSTVTVYDADGHQTKVTNPDGSFTAYTYDAAGNQISISVPDDNNGVATTHDTYDLGGRLVSSVSPLSSSTTRTVSTLSFYDLAGRCVASGGTSAQDASGTSSVFDTQGWVIRAKDANAVVTSSTFDADGHVLKAVVGGKETDSAYDGCGRLTSQSNPNTSTITNTYDGFGRLTRETLTTPKGVASDITHAYDAAGRETSMTNAVAGLGRTMSYASNSAHSSVTTLTLPTLAYSSSGGSQSPVTTDLYTLSNLSLGSTPGGGSYGIWSCYRGFVSCGDPGAPTASWTLKQNGSTTLCSGLSPQGTFTPSSDIVFNAGDSISLQLAGTGTWSGCFSDTWSHTFTSACKWPAGQQAVMPAVDGGSSEDDVWDPDNEVWVPAWDLWLNQDESAFLSLPLAPASAGSVVTTCATFTDASHYSPTGAETAQVLAWSSGLGALSATRSVTATDSAGRTTAVTFTAGGTSLPTTYTYDSMGRLVGQAGLGLSGAASVSYAGTDTPTGQKLCDYWPVAWSSAASTRTFDYGPDGRLTGYSAGSTAATYTYLPSGSMGQVAAGSTVTSFTYDSVGRLASRYVGGSLVATYGYDPATGWRTSQTSSGVATSFAYDGSGELTTVTVGGSTLATYTYDASGQRTGYTSIDTSGTTNRAYHYEGLVLHSLDGTLTSSNSTSTYSVVYAYTAEGQPYAGVYDSSDASPTLFGIVTDDHGDVIALTDASGNTFAKYTYDPWGNFTPQTRSTSGANAVSAGLASAIVSRQPLTYSGYVYDSSTGLYYCSARYYDPATYQFLTPDKAEADGEESAYQYCDGDPVGRADSSGTYSERFSPGSGSGDQDYYLWTVLRVDAGYALEHLIEWDGEMEWYLPWFKNIVKTDSTWDFKRVKSSAEQDIQEFKFLGHWISWDDWGNIHFGFVAYWTDISDEVAKDVATAVGLKHGSTISHELGNRTAIDFGWNLAKNHPGNPPLLRGKNSKYGPNEYSAGPKYKPYGGSGR